MRYRIAPSTFGWVHGLQTGCHSKKTVCDALFFKLENHVPNGVLETDAMPIMKAMRGTFAKPLEAFTKLLN